MSIKLTRRNERLIMAGREQVWQAFSQISEWPAWSPGIREINELQPGLAGSSFTLSLSPWGLSITAQARLETVQTGRHLSYVGQKLGIRTRHSFSFLDAGKNTQAVSVEELWGWPLLLLYPFVSLDRLDQAGRLWLQALALKAETGAF